MVLLFVLSSQVLFSNSAVSVYYFTGISNSWVFLLARILFRHKQLYFRISWGCLRRKMLRCLNVICQVTASCYIPCYMKSMFSILCHPHRELELSWNPSSSLIHTSKNKCAVYVVTNVFVLWIRVAPGGGKGCGSHAGTSLNPQWGNFPKFFWGGSVCTVKYVVPDDNQSPRRYYLFFVLKGTMFWIGTQIFGALRTCRFYLSYFHTPVQ